MFEVGSIVIVLRGHLAGKKAVVVKSYEKGHGGRAYKSALLLGLKEIPKLVKYGDVEALKKSLVRIAPFIKIKNIDCLLATRYTLPIKIPFNCEKKREGAEKVEFLKDVRKFLIKYYLEKDSVDESFGFFYRKLEYAME